MPVKVIKLETFAQRAVLLACSIFLLAGSFFCIKWGLAHSASSKADSTEAADLLVTLAPNDPQTHFAAAVLHEKTFLPDDLSISLAEFEKAAALAPDNYLLWLELGDARGRSGDLTGSENALRKALALAPNYATVQWALGNNLLRQGKTGEAFELIRLATKGDDKYTSPAAVTAWQTFDGDLAQVRQAVGDSSRISAALAVFLAGNKRFDEAFTIWDTLPAEEKRTIWRSNTEAFYTQLLEAKNYPDAARVYSEALADPDSDHPAPGHLTNGGFESDLKPTGASIFEWQIADGLQPQINVDTGQKHSGGRSLVLIFNSAYVTEFRPVSQTVVVEPGKTYSLGLFYKADLKTTATFYWQIADAGGKVIASTDSILSNSDWQRQQVKFTAPTSSDAIVVRLMRAQCGSGICPITGRLWFDDISINAE